VVRPESTKSCQDPTYFAEHSLCKSINVVGAGFTAFLFSAILSNPIWLLIVKKLGKVEGWLFWSLSNALTNFLYISCGWSGGQDWEVWWVIALCGLNGFPMGGKFLADSILSDIIDYDEFLTGSRNEAVYTMFKGFLPKISAIPAIALPVAVLQALGHVPPEDGVVQEQPPVIRFYCLFVCSIVTPCMALLGTWIKAQFPLKQAHQFESLSRGIALHIDGAGAKDPITGIDYRPFQVDAAHRRFVDLLDAFPGIEPIARMETYLLAQIHFPQVNPVSLGELPGLLSPNQPRESWLAPHLADSPFPTCPYPLFFFKSNLFFVLVCPHILCSLFSVCVLRLSLSLSLSLCRHGRRRKSWWPTAPRRED